MRPTDLPNAPVIVWFRSDLRIGDNLALSTAAQSGRPVVALFVLDDGNQSALPPGAASRWWLHHSLDTLSASLLTRGLSLVLRRGDPRTALDDVIAATGAGTVLWNRRYAPDQARADQAVKADLRQRGLAVHSFDGALLHEPTALTTKSGEPYRVYSPFWRALTALDEPRLPAPAPERIAAFGRPLATDTLCDWNLLPTKPDWSTGLAETWTPGEAGAHKRLSDFIASSLNGYQTQRDLPGMEGTSRLSPHLAFGEITPFAIWQAAIEAEVSSGPDRTTFLKELVWREFSYHLLFHNRDLKTANFNRGFDAFPWREDTATLRAWQRGQTGYPIVDAGMRQLWQTGWMHNRVRMIVASFLVKHLLTDWRHGERWFWDTLVDADPASNTASWQWVAGSGADAAPYFRVFNPILQGNKFDTQGTYVRRFVPELARLPDQHIHEPWEAPAQVLADAGVRLGTTYPEPIVDHPAARKRALAAYELMRGQAA